jgi:hypothetical protein
MKKALLSIIAIAIAQISSAQWVTSGTNMYSLNGGNVGIGTTIPIAPLDIKLATNQHVQFLPNVNGAFNGTPGIVSVNDAGTAYTSLGFYANNYYFGLGRLGIGATAPLAMLDINSEVGITPLRVVGPAGYLLVDNVGSGENYYKANSFHQFQNASSNPILTMFNSGTIGIGTTIPDAKLAVNGTIHAKEVKVDLTGWADYVFRPNYGLPSLTAVRTYIDQNHHLPGIPSEDQVKKEGIDLGEINKLLIGKVEELTLYLIQQKEENEAQQKLISNQQKADQSQQEQIDQLKEQLSIITKALTKN